MCSNLPAGTRNPLAKFHSTDILTLDDLATYIAARYWPRNSPTTQRPLRLGKLYETISKIINRKEANIFGNNLPSTKLDSEVTLKVNQDYNEGD